jgi:N-acetylgalactosamine-N,N'-diacetylbacillosaminyl-diphospho-undecaprenol 4-alpha-N-acetylgalactosaminyltransferase
VQSKNFDMLIRAHAVSGIAHTLLIVGEGPERAALEETARTWGVADRVLLPGFAANPYALMRGADLFVLSSNAEGFPNALVEAMALGVPVVATNCASGPSEILADAPRHAVADVTFAEHGVLVPPDATDAMAQVVAALAQDEKRRRLYGERAAARALGYSALAAKDRYWAVIRDALASGARLA